MTLTLSHACASAHHVGLTSSLPICHQAWRQHRHHSPTPISFPCSHFTEAYHCLFLLFLGDLSFITANHIQHLKTPRVYKVPYKTRHCSSPPQLFVLPRINHFHPFDLMMLSFSCMTLSSILHCYFLIFQFLPLTDFHYETMYLSPPSHSHHICTVFSFPFL